MNKTYLIDDRNDYLISRKRNGKISSFSDIDIINYMGSSYYLNQEGSFIQWIRIKNINELLDTLKKYLI